MAKSYHEEPSVSLYYAILSKSRSKCGILRSIGFCLRLHFNARLDTAPFQARVVAFQVLPARHKQNDIVA
jgi:hypothetical protein